MAHQPRFSRTALTVAAAVSLLSTVVITAAASPAGAQPARPAGTQPAAAAHIASHRSVTRSTSPLGKLGALSNAAGRHTVFVQLSGSGAAAVSRAAIRTTSGTSARRETTARSAALARRAAVNETAARVMGTAKAHDARTVQLFKVSNAVPGVALNVDAAGLEAVAARPDVVKISPIVPKTASNASAAQLTRVLNAWQDAGNTGANVTVGVIDTGLDYTHADFGGIGTVDAFNAAKATSDSLVHPWYDDLPALAKAKVAGGFDFVGDSYDATATDPTYQPIPRPDPNPLGCGTHGTHVAGTVAGYGENSDGSTFTGDYSTLTGSDLDAMKIGPGMAPEAKLYALKVFGCTGSTDVVIPALDAALDPNGDGNFADHLDIVNLSLGSDYSTVDDPENDVVNALAAGGVLPVISMGNSGDLTDTGGSPGNAVRSLAVASSVDASQLRDGLRVNAPGDVAGIVAGQNASAYSYTDHPTPVTGAVAPIPADHSITGDVNSDGNLDGCNTLTTAQAAAVNGKVAWLEWDDNDASRQCGSVARSANVKAAGAIGAIFTSGLNVFGAGITGDTDIPVFQLPKAGTDQLRPAVVAGTLNVTFDGALASSINDVQPGIADTLSSFSSRGTHGSIGVVKPDVTAPGDTIVSAGLGTGTGVLLDSGTSMAAPHAAGIAALVKFQHPTWSVEQIKAAVMNTANHDLFTGENHGGDIYGPARVGAGRVDALDAVSTHVIAFDSDTDEPGGVSASFGVVEAPADQPTVTKTRRISVENTGVATVSLSVSYDSAVSQPGVAYSVSPSTVDVNAGDSAFVTVTMTVTTADLRHTIDPTMAVNQTIAAFGADFPRQFVSDSSGRVLISQSGLDDLRVPVYGAAKPVSTITASAGHDALGSTLDLSGTGVDQGTGSSAFTSLVSVMDLGATSDQLPACTGPADVGCTINETAAAGDIQYVGADSSRDGGGSLANGWLYFGVSTYANNATIGNSTIPYVDIDTTGDGVPDFEVFVQNIASTDELMANLVDLNTDQLIDIEPVNFNFGDVDTNVFDSNTIMIPVWPAEIGLSDTDSSFPITYSVGTNSAYGLGGGGTDVDHVGPVSFDVVRPAVAVDSPLFIDDNGASIAARVSAPNTKALVIHLHNASGTRAQVVNMSPAKASAPTSVRATAGNAAARVSWTAPAHDGGAAVTGYDVQFSSNNGSTWHSASSTFHTRTATTETVTGLVNATSYVFRVAAITAAGTGAYSTKSGAVKPVADRSALTIGGTVSIHKGQYTSIRGTLTDTTTHKPIVGAKVLLYRRVNKAGTRYAVAATGTTDGAGHLSRSQQPSVSTRYLWLYTGSATHARAESVSQLVNVS